MVVTGPGTVTTLVPPVLTVTVTTFVAPVPTVTVVVLVLPPSGQDIEVGVNVVVAVVVAVGPV